LPLKFVATKIDGGKEVFATQPLRIQSGQPKIQPLVMEELLTLKELLLKGDVPGALVIVEELEEMSRNDIIRSIRSYAVILLLHLIKQ
jgi:hypothetical protein